MTSSGTPYRAVFHEKAPQDYPKLVGGIGKACGSKLLSKTFHIKVSASLS
jgi:hypothetical protein